MTVAQFPSEVAQRILLLLEDNQINLLGNDGMIFYGDQKRVPVTPTVCVEAGTTGRTLAGVPQRTENALQCHILLYYAKVDSNQTTKLECEQLAEAIVRYLDSNLTLERSSDGGIVIHGYVTSIDPGYTYKDGTQYQAVRLTWTGKSKTMLGA